MWQFLVGVIVVVAIIKYLVWPRVQDTMELVVAKQDDRDVLMKEAGNTNILWPISQRASTICNDLYKYKKGRGGYIIPGDTIFKVYETLKEKGLKVRMLQRLGPRTFGELNSDDDH